VAAAVGVSSVIVGQHISKSVYRPATKRPVLGRRKVGNVESKVERSFYFGWFKKYWNYFCFDGDVICR